MSTKQIEARYFFIIMIHSFTQGMALRINTIWWKTPSPFGRSAVPEYCPTFGHFTGNSLMSVHCKKYIPIAVTTDLCCRQKEKRNFTITNRTDFLELLEVWKPSYFYVRSLHCCQALLKIIKCKSLHLRNYYRQPRNSKKLNSFCTRLCTVRFVSTKNVRWTCTIRNNNQ
jgi:hypothetical protein